MRNKIHGYARACLETLGFELKTQIKFNFVQLEDFKTEERKLKARLERFEKDNAELERQVMELTKFIKWEEIAHNQFTESLKKDEITVNDINSAANR